MKTKKYNMYETNIYASSESVLKLVLNKVEQLFDGVIIRKMMYHENRGIVNAEILLKTNCRRKDVEYFLSYACKSFLIANYLYLVKV